MLRLISLTCLGWLCPAESSYDGLFPEWNNCRGLNYSFYDVGSRSDLYWNWNGEADYMGWEYINLLHLISSALIIMWHQACILTMVGELQNGQPSCKEIYSCYIFHIFKCGRGHQTSLWCSESPPDVLFISYPWRPVLLHLWLARLASFGLEVVKRLGS